MSVIITSNAFTVSRYLNRRARTTAIQVGPLVAQYGALLLTNVRAKASGRPGPRAITGDYRRSWTLNLLQQDGSLTASVGTNRPQGRRLEFGFVGIDALGRHYNQPPFPHAEPALAEVGPRFVQALLALGARP